jgi:hypothetical protein
VPDKIIDMVREINPSCLGTLDGFLSFMRSAYESHYVLRVV